MTDDLRAITVRQPWAWAIARGGKTVENRSRGTRYRGRLLIHAGAGWSTRGDADPRVLAAWKAAGHPYWNVDGVERVSMSPRIVPLAAVIAVAQLVDSHPDADCCRPWGESSYTEGDGRLRTVVHHLVLEDVRPLAEPIPARGALGLWLPAADVAARAADARRTSAAKEAGFDPDEPHRAHTAGTLHCERCGRIAVDRIHDV